MPRSGLASNIFSIKELLDDMDLSDAEIIISPRDFILFCIAVAQESDPGMVVEKVSEMTQDNFFIYDGMSVRSDNAIKKGKYKINFQEGD